MNRAEQLIRQIQVLVGDYDPSEAEIFKAAVGAPEINTTDRMKSLAGKLEHHSDPNVRSLAGLVLRHVERLETGR